jgi:hypothetical protein
MTEKIPGVIYDGDFNDDDLVMAAPRVRSIDGGYIIFIGLSNGSSRLIATSDPYRRLSMLSAQFGQFSVSIERTVVLGPVINYLLYRIKIANVLKANGQKSSELGEIGAILVIARPILEKIFRKVVFG